MVIVPDKNVVTGHQLESPQKDLPNNVRLLIRWSAPS